MTMREPIDPTAWWAQWKAGSYGCGTRHWFVSRYLDGPGTTGQTANSADGKIRWFKTYDAAKRAADKLNAGKVFQPYGASA